METSEVTDLLRDIEQRLGRAWVEGNRDFIEDLLADDWTVIDLAGNILNKREVIAEAFESDERQIVSMEIDEIDVRLHGGCAIVTGRTRATGSYQDQEATVLLRFTDVFTCRDGKWRVVASQATLLDK